MENNRKKYCVQALMLITTPKLADKAEVIFKKANLALQYRFNAEGTAPNEIIDMLGLGSVDKCALLSLLPKELSGIMLDKLKTELQMHAVNSGIAFTIPLNGINNLILRILSKNAEENGISLEGKDETEMSENKHALVVAVVNRGFSEDVMDAAKKVGATGGTVIHSRHTGNEEASGFWGLSVQDEQEIVMILTDAENKKAIMQSIGEHCGMHSEAKGIVVSVPIDAVVGI